MLSVVSVYYMWILEDVTMSFLLALSGWEFPNKYTLSTFLEFTKHIII